MVTVIGDRPTLCAWRGAARRVGGWEGEEPQRKFSRDRSFLGLEKWRPGREVGKGLVWCSVRDREATNRRAQIGARSGSGSWDKGEGPMGV